MGLMDKGLLGGGERKTETLTAVNTRSRRGFTSKIIHDFCVREPALRSPPPSNPSAITIKD
jgi:hypothetical protein